MITERKEEAADSPGVPEPKKRWFEPACVLLMAASSLSTAWCSYQNAHWNGRANGLRTQADKLERKSIGQYLESRQIESVQASMFMESVNAQMQGDEKLARFYIDRFAGELKPAYEKWIALNPFENPSAPPHPFTPELYTPHFQQDIRNEQAEAAQASAQSSAAGQNAGGYLSNTVLLATVLFFAGTASKFDQRHVRWASLTFAVALFLYAATRMLMLPVA